MSDQATPMIGIGSILSGSIILGFELVTGLFFGRPFSISNLIYGCFLLGVGLFILFLLPDYLWWPTHTQDRVNHIKEQVDVSNKSEVKK